MNHDNDHDHEPDRVLAEELRAALEQEATQVSLVSPVWEERRYTSSRREPERAVGRRVMVAAVAAVALLGAVAGAVALDSGSGQGGGGVDTSGGALAAAPDTTTAPESAPTTEAVAALDECANWALSSVGAVEALQLGNELPPPTVSPSAGPAPGSDPLEPGEAAVHWTLDGGPVELRWNPGGAAARYPADAPVYSLGSLIAEELRSISVHLNGMPGDPLTVTFLNSEPPPAACPELVLHDLRNAERRWAPVYVEDLFALQPIATAGPSHPEGVPGPTEVDECWVPGRSGTTGGPEAERFADPVEAVDALIVKVNADAGEMLFMAKGYDEFRETDGSRTYAMEFGEYGLAMLISVVPSADGWYVDEWMTSC